MIRAILAAALALPAAPILAHEALTHAPPIYEVRRPLDAPPPGEGRIRLVRHDGVGAMLDANQFWHWRTTYDATLKRLALRMPLRSAEAHARHAAWDAVMEDPRGLFGPVVFFRVD